MNSQILANWIQIVTGIGVLGGLVLVIWELQQSRDLVLAQLEAEGFISYQESKLSIMGEDFAATYAKACFDPTSLTDAELVQMAAYADANAGLVSRARAYSEIGESSDRSWEQGARRITREWLSTKVGRAEYVELTRRGRLSPWIAEVADQLIAEGALEDCRERYSYFELVRREGDPLLQ